MPGHWGVAARVERGACVNILGSAMAQAARKGLARPLASAPRTRVGRRVPCQGSSPPDPDGSSVEAFLVSTMVVGLAEIGDKTQILSLMARGAIFTPAADHLWHPVCHHYEPCDSRPGGIVFWRPSERPAAAVDSRAFLHERRGVGAVSRQIRGQRQSNRRLGRLRLDL